MLQDAVISEVRKICDVFHFLEIRDMSGIFSNLTNLYRIYNVLPVSSASAERRFSRLKQIKATHAQQWIRSDCRTFLC